MEDSLVKKIVRELQADLPLTAKPYAEIAKRCGISEDELLTAVKELQEKGVIRRMGAVLRHHNLGITANGMGVWQIAPEETERIGKIMASFPEVSHCYERPTFPDWPYNLFTMIHAKTPEECKEIADRISAAIGGIEYRLLFSSREFKKSSMIYY